jgi:hypothetical protein
MTAVPVGTVLLLEGVFESYISCRRGCRWPPGENLSSQGAGDGDIYVATFLKAPSLEASTLVVWQVCVN